MCTAEPAGRKFIIMNFIFCIQEEPTCLECCKFCIDLLTFMATAATVGVSVYAVWYAIKEYSLHKKEEEANTLARYNERYSTNEHLLTVVEYLWRVEDKKDSCEKSYNEIVDDFKNNEERGFKIPTEHEKELFLRFFEEIQFSIEQGTLNKYQVKDLFFYYAEVANRMGEAFVKDYNKYYWRQFKVFVKTMDSL